VLVTCSSPTVQQVAPGALWAGSAEAATGCLSLHACRTTKQTIESLKAAGFEVLDVCDLATTADIPWWDPVDPDNWWRLQSES
jgi:hypothetical protein